MQLTPASLELLPSDADVAFYNEHGYYVSEKILTDEEIDEAVYGSERFYAGERDFNLTNSVKPFEGWKPEDGDGLRINDYLSLQNRELSALVSNPLLGAIAARLCGSSSVRLWHDQMIYKPIDEAGNKTGIGWHTDRSYWQTCTSEEMLTAWIPFHDCDEAMGTLTFIDGSHHWPHDAELKGFHSSDLQSTEEKFTTASRSIVKIPVNLKKGQVTFHHCRTIHGSASNTSLAPRHSLSVHIQDEANRYREVRKEDGSLIWHRNDILCRSANGHPDYTDDDICFPLWRAE